MRYTIAHLITVVNVTDEDILHIFNEHRQNLIPPAADMMLLRWNEELGDHADSVARYVNTYGISHCTIVILTKSIQALFPRPMGTLYMLM